jgi:ATP-dependent helicase/nuclease subunit A
MSGSGSLHRLEGDQHAAAVPAHNIWLSASAGTGKTQVLTARVLRLLLQGVRPDAILGLTYTKAGASEMAQRVRRVLAEWVQIKDNMLAQQIYMIGGDHHDPEVLARARTLFAKVIDAPGQGLAFQTIHSFCQSLLGAFPLEAGLPPGFRAIEEREAVLLRREVLTALTETAEAEGNGWFLDGLGALAEQVGEGAALGWIDRCAAAAPALLTLPAEIAPWLRHELDLPVSEADDWLMRWCSGEGDPSVDEIGLQAVADGFAAWGANSGLEAADRIASWLAAGPADRVKLLDTVTKKWLTAAGTLSGNMKGGFVRTADVAMCCGQAVRAAQHTAAAMRASDRLAAALRVGRHFAIAWSARKQRDGLVDFDDLINHAAKLLDSDQSAWIRYKLDSRIDHILVDEAQDTNAQQWQIVRQLTDEFFAGEGATDPQLRTLFVVGDYKQAIFGFQGTSPQFFAAAEEVFRELGNAAERPFAQLALATNYRSEPEILRMVDEVIGQLGPEKLGLGADAVIKHGAVSTRTGGHGQVTLWPTINARQKQDDDDDSNDEESWVDDATLRLADRIACQVKEWVANGLDGAPVEPGDVLVLVRRRKDLAGLIVARLQAQGVAVAGVDRLALHRPLAVQDLLAAARFVLQPLDDLNLAALLVSPLLGFSQEELWEYGVRPKGEHLWPHLRAQEQLAPRLEPLRTMLRMADFVTPYRFFETILSGPIQGRAKLLARLGNAARDPIDEVLSAALQVGARDGPSLHHFLTWFDSGDIEIKRENDVDSKAARVMTVHGAKGLEARLVILADAAANPDSGGHDGGIDWTIPGKTLSIPVDGIRAHERPAVIADAYADQRERDREEHWRLLYVAMTRARERLFVTGTLSAQDKGAPAEDSWYAVIQKAMNNVGGSGQTDPIWGQCLRFPARAKAPRRERATKQERGAQPVPEWVQRPPPAEPRPPRPLAPSRLGDEQALAVPVPPGDSSHAARRGIVMHALFERLPAVAVDRRRAALRWLTGQAREFSDDEHMAMVDAVLAVIDNPEFAWLFNAESIGEVPFSALVDGQVITGTADRLFVGTEHVAVVDFKTGGHVPSGIADVPSAYVKQMAAYAAALSVIFPEKAVSAFLLYTAGPRMITVPSDWLIAHRPGKSG